MSVERAQTIERDVILAADDNESNLLLLEEYLWQWGFDVVVARDGREAVALFDQHSPALVVLDVMMPVMDGYEACRRIRSAPHGRRVPIVMLTALTGTEDKIRALEEGADDFLNKPINRQELRARIRSLLRVRQLRSELDSSENIIVTLNSALENKDPRSGGHVHRVASYAGQICERLGLRPTDRETIVKGALLHDLGMIGMPEEQLRVGRDSDEMIAAHTTVGASILAPMRTFQRFLPIVRSHHERLDGSGYPDALSGDQIPLEAQIVGVANRYDELRHGPDMPARGVALHRLRQEADEGKWDRELVDALADALDEQPPRATRSNKRLQPHESSPLILVVDDNRTNRELIGASLHQEGLRSEFAENGVEALQRLEQGGVDLVMLDLFMPVQDGSQTLACIRAESRYDFLPVIVLTAQRSDELRQSAILGGADDFLTFPLHRVELITRIRSLLRIREYHGDLELSQNVICALALTLEAKDPYTKGHSQRVGDLAYAFARHLGVSEARAERIRVAGILHDIGKLAVPEALLNKPGPLTRDEFMKVIDHPVIGEEICRPLGSLASVLALIRHHHERYDGRGYPDSLEGESIPYEVRMLSIVDAYDALTSDRAYRPAPLSHDAAIQTLQREAKAGKWDPRLVDAFVARFGPTGPDWNAIARPAPPLAPPRPLPV